MTTQKAARASPELRRAPLSPRYRRNYTTRWDATGFRFDRLIFTQIFRFTKPNDENLLMVKITNDFFCDNYIQRFSDKS
jgi:hypothetical protein